MVKVVNPFNKSEEECYTAAHNGCNCGGTYTRVADRVIAAEFGGCSCSCSDSDTRFDNKADARDS